MTFDLEPADSAMMETVTIGARVDFTGVAGHRIVGTVTAIYPTTSTIDNGDGDMVTRDVLRIVIDEDTISDAR